MITYPRNLEAKYVLFRISTGETIKDNATYPVADGGEVPGLDPDYIYLEKTVGAVPDYDPRIFVRTTTETPDVENGTWTVAYSTEKRLTGEIETAITNEEANANQSLLPYQRQLKTMILGLGVLFRQLESATLTNKEVAIKQQVMGLATKVWKNDAALKAKLAEIAAGTEPDPDSEWEK